MAVIVCVLKGLICISDLKMSLKKFRQKLAYVFSIINSKTLIFIYESFYRYVDKVCRYVLSKSKKA